MRIDTSRLVLRPLTPTDTADLERIGGDARVAPMLIVPTVLWPEATVRAFIDVWAWHVEPGFLLAICLRDGAMIGSAGLSRGGEVFYFLDPAHWRYGYGQEAMAAFLRSVFAHFDLPHVEAEVLHDNPGSAALLIRLGFVHISDGIGRSAARLEPAPVSRYRLARQALRTET